MKRERKQTMECNLSAPLKDRASLLCEAEAHQSQKGLSLRHGRVPLTALLTLKLEGSA